MRRFAIVLLALLPCVGCGTPDAVKKLSAEQTRVMSSYQQTLADYTLIIANTADAEVTASQAIIDYFTDEIDTDFKQKAINAIQGGTPTPNAMTTLTSDIAANHKQGEELKSEISRRFQRLKDKQDEMKAAYEQILDAQKKLNEYIQLKKVDDVLLDELAKTIGVSREKVTAASNDIVKIGNEIDSSLAALKGLAK